MTIRTRGHLLRNGGKHIACGKRWTNDRADEPNLCLSEATFASPNTVSMKDSGSRRASQVEISPASYRISYTSSVAFVKLASFCFGCSKKVAE